MSFQLLYSRLNLRNSRGDVCALVRKRVAHCDVRVQLLLAGEEVSKFRKRKL